MIGYGKYDNMTVFGWVLKLFGERGATTACFSGDKPDGWVTFATKNLVITPATSLCKVQTQWTFVYAASSQTLMQASSVFLTVAEDDSITTTAATATMMVAGGINLNETYGLGTWGAYLVSLNVDGVLLTPTGDTPAGYAEGAGAGHKIIAAAVTTMRGL